MQIPLFIRALPLSLKTFWRYLILLPFLAVAAFALSLAGMIPVLDFWFRARSPPA